MLMFCAYILQNPLVKYVFKVADLFNDLQNGVLLCRVIQLLQHDPSILKVCLFELKMSKEFDFL